MFLAGKLVLGIFLMLAALPRIRQSNHPTCSERLRFLQELRAWVAPWPEAWILVRRCGGGGSAVDGDQVVEYCALRGLAPSLKGWIRSLDSSLTHMPFLLTHLPCCSIAGYLLDASTVLFRIARDWNHEPHKPLLMIKHQSSETMLLQQQTG